MKWRAWLKLLIVLIVPIALTGIGAMLLRAEYPTLGSWAVGLGGAAFAAWSLFAGVRTIQGSERRWGKYVQAAVETLIALAGVAAINYAFTGTLRIEATLLGASVGIAVLVWVFTLLMALARWALGFGVGPLGPARAVLDEAIRMKVALVFVVLLLVTIPMLPMVLGEDEPLRYRVQTFMSYGLFATGILLSLMTILLACATLANEIRDKQIYTIAVKPIGRVSYLFGKWLGIVVLNAVLILVAGAAIYGFAVFYLARQAPQDEYDAMALRDQVLVARVTATPKQPENLDALVEQQFQALAVQDPAFLEIAGGEDRARQQIGQRILGEWYGVGPMETESYVFDDMGPVIRRWNAKVRQWQSASEAAQAAGRAPPPQPEPEFVQLRYKVEASDDVEGNEIDLLFNFNGAVQPLRMVLGSARVVRVPVQLISPEGRLEIMVRNPNPQAPTIFFDKGDGLQLLYKVDDFTPNYLRGIAAMWVKLAFLAMLGLMAASFLGFPVACLLSLLIYAAASSSSYLLESAGSFGLKPENILERVIYEVLRTIATVTAHVLRAFSEFSPIQSMVEGLYYSWSDLLGCILWVGVIWTGVVGAVAAIAFKNRELARVQV